MTGVGDDSPGRLLGRPWLVVGFLLAIGATLALVLSDDLRFLRLGIVAALWAALIGAFLAVRYRKHAAHSEDTVAEAQAVYELELEREIAARREYELEIEAETREAAQAHSREELEALRAEVSALRESLQSLFGGGEVLLERVALTAQATRMRSLGDDQRLVAAAPETKNGSQAKNGNGKKPAQLMAPKKVEVNERPTEMMDRVLEPSVAERRRKPSNGVVPHGPGPGGPPGPNGKPPSTVTTQRTQQLSRPKPVNRPQPEPQESPAARAVKAAELRAEASRRDAPEPHSRREVPEPQPTRTVAPVAKPEPAPAEVTRHASRPQPRPEDRPADEPRSAMRPAYRPEPDPRRAEVPQSEVTRAEPRTGASPSAPRRSDALADSRRTEPSAARAETPRSEPLQVPPVAVEATTTWKPAWDGGRKPAETFQPRDDFAERQRPPAKENPPKPREASNSRTDLPSLDAPAHVPDSGPRQPSRLEQFSRQDLSPLSAEPAPASPARHGAHHSPAEEPPEPPVNPTLPEAVRSSVSAPQPGGRRRRAEDEPAPEPTGGGRRRRADGEPPSWQGVASGSHREAEPVEEAEPARGRRSAEDAPSSGSHTAGRSVTELLAANGADAPSPRRRRRAED
ncbi:DUF6779 domain-containing protein [Amycolatopsis sp. PS_44_ISF1]|uniref:DUF6779 domain-containing protein n=1 Tax=Amycolatopsis sp. PS_44_ISF1 TaxID=2974917 RepID=UPI0028DE9E39|nr:DUF6779 domain-containing protein [Amycolatopsis sp. PS_44_ISF1]MDT8910964.1 hypothetical protein [Amycolatopsis sp. PS_44_ISF1]